MLTKTILKRHILQCQGSAKDIKKMKCLGALDTIIDLIIGTKEWKRKTVGEKFKKKDPGKKFIIGEVKHKKSWQRWKKGKKRN